MRLRFIEEGLDVCISTERLPCYPFLFCTSEPRCGPQSGITALYQTNLGRGKLENVPPRLHGRLFLPEDAAFAGQRVLTRGDGEGASAGAPGMLSCSRPDRAVGCEIAQECAV